MTTATHPRSIGFTFDRALVLLVLWVGVVMAGGTMSTPVTHATTPLTAGLHRPAAIHFQATDQAFQAVGRARAGVATNIGTAPDPTITDMPSMWTMASLRASGDRATTAGRDDVGARGPPS